MNLKNKYKGKIITLVGSPASGKTFLGNVLKDKLDAVMLYEHPISGFPDQIKSNLKNQENLFETILFFRNIQIDNHLEAIQLSNNNQTVIIDTPFYQNQLFIELYIKNNFSKKILYKLGEHDISIYKPSDVTIFISTTPQLVKEFLKKRHGEREWEEDDWFSFISQMPPIVDSYLNEIQNNLVNLITIKRELFDFSKNKDKQKMFSLLKNVTFIDS